MKIKIPILDSCVQESLELDQSNYFGLTLIMHSEGLVSWFNEPAYYIESTYNALQLV